MQHYDNEKVTHFPLKLNEFKLHTSIRGTVMANFKY